MDNNHMDDYMLVLEDRTEVKNEAEVGKLSVVSNIDEKGKLKTAPAEEAALCPMICAHFVAAFAPNVQEELMQIELTEGTPCFVWRGKLIWVYPGFHPLQQRYFHKSYPSI